MELINNVSLYEVTEDYVVIDVEIEKEGSEKYTKSLKLYIDGTVENLPVVERNLDDRLTFEAMAYDCADSAANVATDESDPSMNFLKDLLAKVYVKVSNISI